MGPRQALLLLLLLRHPAPPPAACRHPPPSTTATREPPAATHLLLLSTLYPDKLLWRFGSIHGCDLVVQNLVSNSWSVSTAFYIPNPPPPHAPSSLLVTSRCACAYGWRCEKLNLCHPSVGSVDCGTPSRANVNFASCTVTTFGGTCTPACASGYTGTPTAVCSTGGTWTYGGSCTASMCSFRPCSTHAVHHQVEPTARQHAVPRGMSFYRLPLLVLSSSVRGSGLRPVFRGAAG